MTVTRVALVGAGSVARRHADVLTELGGVRIAGVTDVDAMTAGRLAAACGAAPFGTVEEMLDGTEVDAVYVCVPPFAHGAPERAVLARGLALFVEKPVAADLATAEQLADEVERAGVVTGTGYHWRCLDVVERAARLLREQPALLANGYWLDKRPPVAWWARTDRSGGQVVEQLTHVLDLSRVLLGEPVEVFAASCREDCPAEGDVDDATAATVRFASGAVATFAATSLLTIKHRAALHTVSRALLLELTEQSLVIDDGAHRREVLAGEDPRVVVDREFIDAVRGRREGTRTPYAEAVRSHRLGCAIAASASRGSAVTLAGTPA